MLVWTRGAEIIPVKQVWRSEDGDPPESALRLVAATGIEWPGRSSRNPMRITEERIEAGGPLYVMGTLAGLYDRLRSESVSKMLRDNYTALNLAAISYTMLHTTGLALQDQATAELALRHLRHYAEMVIEINRIIPRIVVEDLRQDVTIHENGTAQRAIENTQQAWQPSSGDLAAF